MYMQGEGQVKVVAAEPLNAEVDPHMHHEGGAEEQRKSNVTTEDDPVREEASEYPHVHDDAGHAHRHLDNVEHSHHQHHDDAEVSHHHHDSADDSHHHHDDEDHSPRQHDADDSHHQHDADNEDHSHSHHDADEDHHHHDAKYENDQNEAVEKPYEDKDVEQVTSGVEHVSVNDERDEETSLVNVDIVWEHGGDTVLLVASFTEWQQFPLHSSDSVHKATFAVPHGRHTYKFIVDGEDRVDTTREHDDGYNILHA